MKIAVTLATLASEYRTECWQLSIVRCSRQPESPRLARSTTAGQQLLLCWHVECFLQSHRGHVQSLIPTHRFSNWPVRSDRSAVAAFGGLEISMARLPTFEVRVCFGGCVYILRVRLNYHLQNNFPRHVLGEGEGCRLFFPALFGCKLYVTQQEVCSNQL